MLQYYRLLLKDFQVEFTVGLSLREQSFIYLFRSLIVGLSRLSRSLGLSGLSDRRDRQDRPTIRICETIVLQSTNNYNAITTTDVKDKEKKRKRVKNSLLYNTILLSYLELCHVISLPLG